MRYGFGCSCRRAAALVGAAFLALSPAEAAETITYKYDARGRLIRVERTGTVNNGTTSTYAHDKANNRTNVTVVK